MDKLKEARTQIDVIDKSMAELFSKRMEIVKSIAEIKRDFDLPITNKEREAEVIESNSLLVNDDIRGYYIDFINETMKLSKQYQGDVSSDRRLITLGALGYKIYLQPGILKFISKYIDLNRKVLIVTDSNVPEQFVVTLKEQCKTPVIACITPGEKSKSFKNFELFQKTMLNYEFSRSDCVIALGGGVIGDLAGFAASTYMRGVDFYNIPTTLLSFVDSSIGGKTAINLNEVKNVVGTFYQPKAVFIDKTLLKTLPNRLLNEGLVEAFKMGVTSDPTLVDLILSTKSLYDDLDEIVFKSLMIKKAIVEQDEKENGVRRILNFGHTFGHAIEMSNKKLYHGEAIGIGMLYVSSGDAKEKIKQFLHKYKLPNKVDTSFEELLLKIKNDKKIINNEINLVIVNKIGNPIIEKKNISDLKGDDLCETY